MTAPVASVRPDTSLHEAVGEMVNRRVGSVVVVGKGTRGIVTESDVLRTAYRTRTPLTELGVTDAMSEGVVTTTKDAPVKAALRTMESHTIKKLPVIDAPKLVGIVTTTDIARHLPERVREVQEVQDRKDDWTD